MCQSRKLVPLAKGRVLKIGIGSGLNRPIYDTAKVEHAWGVGPSEEVIAMAEKAACGVDFMWNLLSFLSCPDLSYQMKRG